MTYKMKGSSFYGKTIKYGKKGVNSPLKQNVETPMAPVSREKKKSKKIGPAISDEMRKDLRKKRDDAEMNLNVSDDQATKDSAKVQKRINEERDYIKKQGKTLKPSY